MRNNLGKCRKGGFRSDIEFFHTAAAKSAMASFRPDINDLLCVNL